MEEVHIDLNPATFIFLIFYHVKNSSNTFLIEQFIECLFSSCLRNEIPGSEYMNLFQTLDISCHTAFLKVCPSLYFQQHTILCRYSWYSIIGL